LRLQASDEQGNYSVFINRKQGAAVLWRKTIAAPGKGFVGAASIKVDGIFVYIYNEIKNNLSQFIF
jgi:hypothetical protein